MNDIQDDIIEYGKMLKKYHRKQERQFKRALLKAYFQMDSFDDFNYHAQWAKILYLRKFLNWYNKQNFEL